MVRRSPLHPDALSAATIVLKQALPINLGYVKTEEIAREMLTIYNSKSRKALLETRKLSPVTKALVVMEIGQVEFFDISLQSVRARMNTAREVMKNPDARWACQIVKGRVQTTRIEDGAAVKRYRNLSPITIEISSMQIGEMKLSKHIESIRTGKGVLGTNHKIKARLLMNEPDAAWTVKRGLVNPNEIYITRVS